MSSRRAPVSDFGPAVLGARAARAAALVVLALMLTGATLRCGEPAFQFYVTFPDAQGLERGSEVLYAGVPVGKVLSLSIHQPDDRSAGRVRVQVGIRNAGLRIREGDEFRVGRAGFFSGARLEILPAEEPGPPIAAGGTISGDAAPVLDAWAERIGRTLGSLWAGEQAASQGETSHAE